jgi:nitrite reductase/ring-hydroxylating ferredoxin subunit
MAFDAPVREVGPGMPAGRVLRRYWQPVALAADLAPATARRVRIMGEDLTLYRGEGGSPFLIAGRCAHRATWLHTGWIEGDCLRCFYHGWKYDGGGQCVEQPAERMHFSKLVRIAAYPAREYAGLIFAWLGEGDAPALPGYADLEDPDAVVVARLRPPGVWPVNYFQILENGVDPVHRAFAHRTSQPGSGVPDIGVKETEYGLEVTALLSGAERKTHFHFPNLVHLTVSPAGEPMAMPMFVWTVPHDDERSMVLTATAVPRLHAERLHEARLPVGAPMATADAHGLLSGARRPQTVTEEDYVALVGQGVVADRAGERLGRSDAGVVAMRRLWQRALRFASGPGMRRPRAKRRQP